MHYVTIAQMLVLLTLANGSPVVAKRVFGSRFSAPLDRNVKFFDGRALLGSSKTVRGLFAAVLATTLAASLIGLNFKIGLLVGVFAMAGDLISSFTKRRLNRPPSSKMIGLDQIPEALVPLLACSLILPLTVIDILVCTALFFFGELLLSPLLYKLGVRDHPY